MSIKGFNIDGNVEKYDYESLENKPSHTASEIDEVLDKIANADLEKGTIKELDVVDLITCESGVYLTGKIIYRKSTISQPFTEWMPMKALLIVSKNGYETYFQWIGSAYILAGLSNAEGEFENEFIKYEFSSFATKDYVNKLIEDIESGAYGKDGKSAYQIAVDNGFEGTETEWLESLKGEQGIQGDKGTDGADGFSPTAKVEQTDNGANITITDKNGTTNATVLNGKDGQSGVDGTDGKDGISATHSWNGTVLTVTSASGTTSANLKGDKGDQGEQGVQGIQGEKGDTGATGSKGADGYTPKKGVDYYTEEDKAEMVNDVKNVCVAKNQGSENVGKILVVGTDGNLVLTDMPEGGASGDVIGTLDESNNILLTGVLANGTYILKYEYEDGTVAEVGTLEVGGIPEPEPDPEATNFADPTSEDWLPDCRLSFSDSSLTTKPLTGAIVTNFITGIQVNDIVKVEGINFTESNNRQALIRADGTVIGVDKAESLSGYNSHIGSVSYDNNTLQFTVADTTDLKKLRFSGMPTGTAQDVKITITRNGKVL